MAFAPRAVVIGMTAPFGSGSTTSTGILSEVLHFKPVRLSSYIKSDFETNNPGKTPSRNDLQTHGDAMRKGAHSGILAERAIEALANEPQVHERIVIDGIRNVTEIEQLRDRFGNRFFLFALECPISDRWARLEPQYENKFEDFKRDDLRDQNEDLEHGQQVRRCVDEADVLIDNNNDITLTELRKKITEYAGLVLGTRYRYATPLETYMNLAYSSAHGSKCLKRQVGAVLVNANPGIMGEVVGQGFNENPLGTQPCVEEPLYGANPSKNTNGKCYRDIVRDEAFVQLAASGTFCPHCGNKIAPLEKFGPPWKCKHCEVNYEDYFWPERAISLCTAVHAEVAALLSAAGRTKGTTLYTTTFPCLQCTEKIAQAGIGTVVFNEPYPDVRAAERLDIAKITALRFEGVRSRRFDEIFSKARKGAGGN